PEQLEVIARIRRSQRHLLRLINDVLSFAKIDAGHLELDIRDFPLHDALDALEPLMTPQIAQRGLRYVYEPIDPRVTAYADPDKVQQILLNLLSNAAKFTDPGGTITIRATATDDTVD